MNIHTDDNLPNSAQIPAGLPGTRGGWRNKKRDRLQSGVLARRTVLVAGKPKQARLESALCVVTSQEETGNSKKSQAESKRQKQKNDGATSFAGKEEQSCNKPGHPCSVYKFHLLLRLDLPIREFTASKPLKKKIQRTCNCSAVLCQRSHRRL